MSGIAKAMNDLLDMGGIDDIRKRARETRETLERAFKATPHTRVHTDDCDWLVDISLLLGTIDRQAAAIQELRASGTPIKVLGGPNDDGKRWALYPITTGHRERLRGLGAQIEPETTPKKGKKGKR